MKNTGVVCVAVGALRTAGRPRRCRRIRPQFRRSRNRRATPRIVHASLLGHQALHQIRAFRGLRTSTDRLRLCSRLGGVEKHRVWGELGSTSLTGRCCSCHAHTSSARCSSRARTCEMGVPASRQMAGRLAGCRRGDASSRSLASAAASPKSRALKAARPQVAVAEPEALQLAKRQGLQDPRPAGGGRAV